MGAATSFFESNNHHIVLLGLDHAGKTTILYRLKKQKMVLATPTVGFNCEKFRVNFGTARGHNFIIWDVGGQESFRMLWPTYLKNATALIYVVDSSDPYRLEESKVELDNILLTIPQNTPFPVIIIANKQDKPDAINSNEIFKQLTKNLSQRFILSTLECCAVTGEGLEVFFSKVLSAIQKCKK